MFHCMTANRSYVLRYHIKLLWEISGSFLRLNIPSWWDANTCNTDFQFSFCMVRRTATQFCTCFSIVVLIVQSRSKYINLHIIIICGTFSVYPDKHSCIWRSRFTQNRHPDSTHLYTSQHTVTCLKFIFTASVLRTDWLRTYVVKLEYFMLVHCLSVYRYQRS